MSNPWPRVQTGGSVMSTARLYNQGVTPPKTLFGVRAYSYIFWGSLYRTTLVTARGVRSEISAYSCAVGNNRLCVLVALELYYYCMYARTTDCVV